MTMTRERAKELAPIIAAYGEGKQIQWFSVIESKWLEVLEPGFSPSVKYRIKPEPKKRLMTRDEVLGFVAHHGQNMVVRLNHSAPHPIQYFSYNDEDIDNYEYAYIDERGRITSEWKQFEIEEGGEE